MRALTVCVDFSDLLAETLTRNRHHFDEYCIVTTPDDQSTIELGKSLECMVHETCVFYADGAVFNKFRAMEEALDVFGRAGDMAFIDADTIWPELVTEEFTPGFLYSPKRRMLEDVSAPIPPEILWQNLPVGNDFEFAGYTQIFHADDPRLLKRPWLETNWSSAAGGDSRFQGRWPPSMRKRPKFEVLHLGKAFTNWCGRVQPYRDGKIPEGASHRAIMFQRMIAARRHFGFRKEKITPTS